MGVPEEQRVLEKAIEVDSEEASDLVDKVANARAEAAYWRGMCEGQALTISYLKDRLNRAEGRTANLATPEAAR